MRLQTRPTSARNELVALAGSTDQGLDAAARLAQRSRRRVDGERGFVAEQVPDHRAQNERDIGVHDRNGDRLERREEPRLVVVGDHDRRRLVGAVDRDLLADVVGVRAVQAGRAHDDHRLGRQVDVLLVLGDVAGDRLVAELRQLDPDLVGRDPVDAVADDRPRPARERVTLRGDRDRRSPIEDVTHRVGQFAQRREDLVAGGAVALGFGAFAELDAIANARRKPAAICA